MRKVVGIIGAMEEEITYLIQRMNKAKRKNSAGLSFFHGFISSCECIVVKAGIGKVNAAMCTTKLITMFDPDYIINTGVAGGISEKYRLNIGDVVVSTDAIEHDVDVTEFGYERGVIPRMDTSVFVTSEYLRKLALKAGKQINTIKVYEGRVLSGDQFIADKEKTHDLAVKFHGDCVEMEGASIAHVCCLHHVECLIIRAISDSADDEATMSYEEFEAQAAINSASITEYILKDISRE